MAVLGEKRGVDVKVWFCDPKRHILAQNRVLWRILRGCLWWRLGCRWFLEPPKKDSRVNNGAQSRACAEAKTLICLNKILLGDRYPRRNHLCQFWWKSVKGLRGGGGSKFASLHWLWSSPLQHSRTIVRVCDSVIL